MRPETNQVRILRDNVQRILSEDLSAAYMQTIWCQVRDEWLDIYPHTAPIIAQMEQQALGRPRVAMQTLLTTMNKFIDGQDTAASYRSETARIKAAAARIQEMLKAVK